jgi:hypothetical protein
LSIWLLLVAVGVAPKIQVLGQAVVELVVLEPEQVLRSLLEPLTQSQ